MLRRLTYVSALALIATMTVGTYAAIQIPDLPPAVEGTDGDLLVSGWRVWHYQDLALAPTGVWTDAGGDVNSDGHGDGIYDPTLHAVVFKYSSVSLNNSDYGGVRFYNHPSGAAVVWLVTGNVTIQDRSSIVVSGQDSQSGATFAQPGPGGFRGARGTVGATAGSAGFGPGGGDLLLGTGWGAGSHGTAGLTVTVPASPTYGNAFILPLIGGSGGATRDGTGGGAGGGAIMIVATGTISVNGAGITAAGGNNPNRYGTAGSGGAIRLIADIVEGNGPLRADSPTPWEGLRGGLGRIFVQANQITLGDPGNPAYVAADFTNSPYYLWAPPETPKIWPVEFVIDGQTIPIPSDPHAKLSFPEADVQFDTQNTVTLNIMATNVPLDWHVVVRVTPKSGDSYTVLADPLQGNLSSSTTSATFSLNRGFGAVQVRAFQPPNP